MLESGEYLSRIEQPGARLARSRRRSKQVDRTRNESKVLIASWRIRSGSNSARHIRLSTPSLIIQFSAIVSDNYLHEEAISSSASLPVASKFCGFSCRAQLESIIPSSLRFEHIFDGQDAEHAGVGLITVSWSLAPRQYRRTLSAGRATYHFRPGPEAISRVSMRR